MKNIDFAHAIKQNGFYIQMIEPLEADSITSTFKIVMEGQLSQLINLLNTFAYYFLPIAFNNTSITFDASGKINIALDISITHFYTGSEKYINHSSNLLSEIPLKQLKLMVNLCFGKGKVGLFEWLIVELKKVERNLIMGKEPGGLIN